MPDFPTFLCFTPLGHFCEREPCQTAHRQCDFVRPHGQLSDRLHRSCRASPATSRRQPSPSLCSRRLEWIAVAAPQHGPAAQWTTLIRTGAPASWAAAAPATPASGRPQPILRTAAPSSTSARLASECPAHPGLPLVALRCSPGWWTARDRHSAGVAGRCDRECGLWLKDHETE